MINQDNYSKLKFADKDASGQEHGIVYEMTVEQQTFFAEMMDARWATMTTANLELRKVMYKDLI